MPHPCSRLRLRLAPWRTASSSDFAIAEPFWRIDSISFMAIFQASSDKLVAGHQRGDGRADEARGRRGGEVRDRRAELSGGGAADRSERGERRRLAHAVALDAPALLSLPVGEM